MDRLDLIDAIMHNQSDWSCPNSSDCEDVEKNDDRLLQCKACAEALLTEYEKAIRDALVEELILKAHSKCNTCYDGADVDKQDCSNCEYKSLTISDILDTLQKVNSGKPSRRISINTKYNGTVILTPEEQSIVYDMYRLGSISERILDWLEENNINVEYTEDGLKRVAERVITIMDDNHVSEDFAISNVYHDKEYFSKYFEEID